MIFYFDEPLWVYNIGYTRLSSLSFGGAGIRINMLAEIRPTTTNQLLDIMYKRPASHRCQLPKCPPTHSMLLEDRQAVQVLLLLLLGLDCLDNGRQVRDVLKEKSWSQR